MVVIDHSLDHLTWDNIQTVTVRTNRNKTEIDTQTAFAFFTELTRRDLTMHGVHNLTVQQRVWVIASVDLDAASPVQDIRKGDKIGEDTIANLDDNTVWWSVISVSVLNDDSVFRCVCMKDR